MIEEDYEGDIDCGDFKIRVDGVDRYVSGVTEHTMCSEIIYALAHSMSKRGKFVLVVRDASGKEKTLAPSERPWKSDAKTQDVEFELREIDDIATASFMNAEHPLHKEIEYEERNGPPPAYHDFIRRRHAMLYPVHPNGLEDVVTSTFSKDSNDLFISSLNLSRTELEVLLQSQSDAIREQKQYMASLDNNLRNNDHLELLQLTKQHANLRTVLDSLKTTDWPHEYRKELEKSSNISNEIDLLKNELTMITEAIECKNSECRQIALSLKEEGLAESVQYDILQSGKQMAKVLATKLDEFAENGHAYIESITGSRQQSDVEEKNIVPKQALNELFSAIASLSQSMRQQQHTNGSSIA
ncbi:hypothetical protein QR680_001852 [Steinernema hermaphroditum]|uniref:Ras-associating domain-containing protein n=1 Tax=Steinernema hermaphroditum TaxID=289476 RepID=A0AA39LGY7_9BILA|nr:hypothetical protein QR680_001852 [Steinernema hermaphroditum]